ncbi:hypothetical protein [Fusobacterium nucleatum]|uniref:hypothetical protein n=1 Tax=Fusobacterium nucleatum TaxID=851 RepID=UPI0003B8A1C4|nr:hypothetical protein [Fusobacterium nucleatum]ERT40344.1 hypothetical protein HMPREF1539_02125 [Fusobacterium nucleatum CTI-2]
MYKQLKKLNQDSVIGIFHFFDNNFSVGKVLRCTRKYLFLECYNINFEKEGIKIFSIKVIRRIILSSSYIEKLQRKKKQSNLEDITKGKEIFKTIIKKKLLLSIDLEDNSNEHAYLLEKENNIFYFCFLDDNLYVTSSEILKEEYISKIQIQVKENEDLKDKKIKRIQMYSGDIYFGFPLRNDGKYLLFYEKLELYNSVFLSIIKKEDIEEITEIFSTLNIKKIYIDKYIKPNEMRFKKLLEIAYKNRIVVSIDNENFSETKIGIISDIKIEGLVLKEIDEYLNFFRVSNINYSEIEILSLKNYQVDVSVK